MGYTTKFRGKLKLDRKIKPWLAAYINEFAETRHIKRNIDEYKKANLDWESKCFNGNPGTDGEYVADRSEPRTNPLNMPEIKDYNAPPGNCPSLWCQWVVTKNRKYIKWSGGEKFQKYAEWLEYLINNFLKPEGYFVNGQIKYYGEDTNDRGIIIISDNEVKIIPKKR